MKQTSKKNLRIVLSICLYSIAFFAFQVLSRPSVAADVYPYVGYFTFQSEKPQPTLMQAKCAHMFYKQNSDGSGVDYILDEKNYAATGAVKYLVFAENWCDFNGAANTNTCLQIIYDNSGSTKSESYDVLQSSDTDSFVNVFFLTKFEQQIYVTATDKTIPSWKLPTATPVYSQRCIGFDDQTLLSHLLPTHSELTQKALAKIMNRPIDAVNFSQVLDIMQKIGTKAAQATLPGQ